jgi:hypothetical protein
MTFSALPISVSDRTTGPMTLRIKGADARTVRGIEDRLAARGPTNAYVGRGNRFTILNLTIYRHIAT